MYPVIQPVLCKNNLCSLPTLSSSTATSLPCAWRGAPRDAQSFSGSFCGALPAKQGVFRQKYKTDSSMNRTRYLRSEVNGCFLEHHARYSIPLKSLCNHQWCMPGTDKSSMGRISGVRSLTAHACTRRYETLHCYCKGICIVLGVTWIIWQCLHLIFFRSLFLPVVYLDWPLDLTALSSAALAAPAKQDLVPQLPNSWVQNWIQLDSTVNQSFLQHHTT